MARSLEDLRDPAGEALDHVDEVVVGRDDREDAVDLDQGELRAVMSVDHRLLALRVEPGEVAELVRRSHRFSPSITANWKTGIDRAKSHAPSTAGTAARRSGAGLTQSEQ